MVVCAGALAWVLNNITYYDYAITGDGTRHRAEFGEDDSSSAVLIGSDGSRRTVELSEIV